MAWTFEQSAPGYLNLWRSAAVKPGTDDHNADLFANKIIAGEAQYRQVQAATGVPWFFVGALHMREGSCDFERALCNGEKIIGTGKLTTLVPAGRGPYASWYDSGIDAMKLKDLHRVQEWSIERMLYSAEAYNGWGYAGKVNSPYVWAGTTQEQSGKYIRDHVFDPSAEDAQLGVAAVLKRLAERRPDIAAAMQPEDGPAAAVGELLSPLAKPAPEVEARIARLEQLLVPFLQQMAGGAPQQQSPTPKPTPAAEPAKPKTSSLGMNIATGVLGVAASLTASKYGLIGPPVGPGSTAAGFLLPMASAGLAAIGVPAWVLPLLGKGLSFVTSKLPGAQQ